MGRKIEFVEAAEFVGSMLANLRLVSSLVKDNPEENAGAQDALEFLDIASLAATDAYALLSADSGEALLNRLGTVANASATILQLQAGHWRIGQEYSQGWRYVANAFYTGCDTMLQEAIA